MKRATQTIDATLQSPGRLASAVARVLMGKTKPSYAPYRDEGDKVEVINVAAMKLDKKKLARLEFIWHTQHPGGLKKSLAKDYTPAQLLRRAVYSMLPKNTLRDTMLKRLTIH